MDIWIFIYNCLTYSISVTIALRYLCKNKFNILVCFCAVFAVNLASVGILERYVMIITVAVLLVFLMLTKKINFTDALFYTANSLALVMLSILIYTNITMLFLPTLPGTTLYNIIIGVLQFVTIIVAAPHVGKFMNINYSKPIKLISILMQSMVIILYGAIIPIIADKPFFTVYAVFGIFTVLLIVCIYYAITYMATIDVKKQVHERELKIAKALYHNVSEVLEKVVISNHYSEGLAKSIIAYLDTGDLLGLKRYFYTKVEPSINKEVKNINTLKNIDIELIQNLIYLTKKRADSKQIPMDIEVVGIVTEINMDTLDLFKVLNIYFDNAIEASVLTENPYIMLKIQNRAQYISIEISNKFKISERVKSPSLDRGHGLKIADKYIAEYANVSKNTFISNDIFTQKLIIGEGENNYENQ